LRHYCDILNNKKLIINQLIKNKIFLKNYPVALANDIVHPGYFRNITIQLYRKIIYHANPKTLKITIKSTVNIFSVESKSTMDLHRSPETRHQPASLSQNTKKINIDQL